MIVFIFLLLISILCLVSLFIYFNYKNIILEHSVLLKQIKSINNKYSFNKVSTLNFQYTYDNEHFYEQISTEDYLIYELVFYKKEVKSNIEFIKQNRILYSDYKKELEQINLNYDINFEYDLKLKFLVKKLVNIYSQKLIQKPDLNYYIKVTLFRTNINGNRLSYKSGSFHMDELLAVIKNIEDKSGDRYNNQEIWNAICRVERGKVSNKMRFSIYERDGHRCKKCGKHDRFANDLEIDHIIPIAKGGKSTYDNLQTLCHKCNVEKGANVEAPFDPSIKVCPSCGGVLVLKKGKYGAFYGCYNYPNCTYTEKYK